MSGITGIFRRDGKDVDPADIKKMNDKIAHRGPDGSRVWCEGPVAFGHQMLHTTQESLHEILPFEDEESGLVITADARIDNRKDLAPQLSIEDNEYVSDSYFILKAYEKWGEKCPEELLGDFAFAIWDKNKEQLFCARDHMGVKPFYYYLNDAIFVFGTEIKAILSVFDVPYELNELKIAYYLMKVFTDKKFTFYKNIFSLTSAHSLTITKNDDFIRKYWEIDPNYNILMDSDEDYIHTFRDIFTEAVRCRLRSSFPLGFDLSGGLDSSSVVCMANHILDKTSSDPHYINTFSMIFNDFPQVDERYYIEKVTTNPEIVPHMILSDNISPLKNIETILWHQEQPFHTPNMAMLWNMYKNMGKNNIRVYLAGEGGDQTISHGKKYLTELAVTFKWKKLIRELNGFSNRVNRNIFNLFIEQVVFPLIPLNIKNFTITSLSSLRGKSSNKKTRILNEYLYKKLEDDPYWEKFNSNSLNFKSARNAHYFDIFSFSNQNTLEMIDKTVSAFCIEPRYPFFDKRLIEYCYGIPTEMKFHHGWNRYIQRVAMNDILPEEIQWRPLKNFFTEVYEKNLLLYEKNLLNQTISQKNRLLKYYINMDKIKDSYKKYEIGEGTVFSNRDLWLVILLDLWLQQKKSIK
ncbi:MAG: asparagine synthase (glutamine-hydrolyzing) [Methanobacteriales archaeon HGW-Methanobacteriales-2]|nr:MAG: asparagine synthase (glutamine-hydrolyzing) [Methanobacteriales archaeon HGW-Methanobacteriales-2]